MWVTSRSLAAISCNMGVKRKKFSRFTSVMPIEGSPLNSFCNSRAVYRPPKPPPSIRIRLALPPIACLQVPYSQSENRVALDNPHQWHPQKRFERGYSPAPCLNLAQFASAFL